MSKDQLKKVRTYLDENLKRGFIRSSKSLTEYLILFVSKKNGTKQLCVNYRQLNEITRQDSYFLTVDQQVARPIRQSQVIHKSELERSLLLSTNEERQRMKNSILNKI